jgi:hypothetical protein
VLAGLTASPTRTLASCLKAAATVALVVATAGEGEVAADLAEDTATSAAEDAGGASGNLVIGKLPALRAPGALRPGGRRFWTS